MVGIRELGLSALLVGAMGMAVSCSSKSETVEDWDHKRKTFLQEFLCPNEPDELTQRIIALEGKNPAGLRNAAEQVGSGQKYHLLRAAGDEAAARKVLHKIFITQEIQCPNFNPTKEELTALANETLKSDLTTGWETAFSLFERLGDKEGQQRAAQRYGNHVLTKDDADAIIPTFNKAAELYHRLDDYTTPRQIAKTLFSRMQRGGIDRAGRIMNQIGIEPDKEFFIARGDYFMSKEDDDSGWEILPAYLRSGNRDKVHALMNRAERECGESGNDNAQWCNWAWEAAEFLGKREKAQQYAKSYFVLNDMSLTKTDLTNFSKAGLQLTPELYRLRGDHSLQKKAFRTAFEAYKKAGYDAGIDLIAAEMAKPLPESASKK